MRLQFFKANILIIGQLLIQSPVYAFDFYIEPANPSVFDEIVVHISIETPTPCFELVLRESQISDNRIALSGVLIQLDGVCIQVISVVEAEISLGKLDEGEYLISFQIDGEMAEVSFTVSREGKPDLITSASLIRYEPTELHLGDSLKVEWTTANASPVVILVFPGPSPSAPAVGSWQDAVFLSRDRMWSPDDIQICSTSFTGTLSAGESYDQSQVCAIPRSPGTFHLIVYVDFLAQNSQGQIIEADERNNWNVAFDSLTVLSGLTGDFNNDGSVDLEDFFLFADVFGLTVTDANDKFDLNRDNHIDLRDFFLFADNFGLVIERP